LVCGIEYLHTSSLIFDDLPAQDNSDLRRGRPTLHKTTINDEIPYNLCEGRAQLAAVDLIAISMNLINHGLIKNGFLLECVNRIVTEISLLMHDLCIGQMMDLRAARVGIAQDNHQLDKLDQIAWFKTGKTIEVVMITPVILIKAASDDNLLRIRELSRLVGILFQMRDDLLDVDGGDAIGKPTALDVKNNTVTYVSILGIEGTRCRLQQFLTQALQLVDDCWPTGAETIKDVINYIVTRKT
jgi:geranylgeranyl pyrophosphate synthase